MYAFKQPKTRQNQIHVGFFLQPITNPGADNQHYKLLFATNLLMLVSLDYFGILVDLQLIIVFLNIRSFHFSEPNKNKMSTRSINLVSGLLVALILLNAGCRKNHDDISTHTKMDNLMISPDFDWETSRNITFNISADYAQVVRIYSENGIVLYHQGLYSILPEPYSISLNLPKTLSRVLINGVLVDITGNFAAVDLSESGAKSSTAETFMVPEPVVYWKFDETSGSTISDSKGLLNGVASGHLWVGGINGNAIEFDGVSAYAQCNNQGIFNPVNDQISFSLWFRLNQTGKGGALLFHNTKYILKIDAQGRLTFALYLPTYHDVVMNYADRILDTDWHHMAAVYDGSSMKLYLDGKLMAEKPKSGNLNSSNAPVFIGSLTSSNYFSGQVDEVRIFGVPLSVQAINELYTNSQNPGGGEASLVSWWKLNENQGGTASDQTGTNIGSITGATWAQGISGSCLSFDGSSGLVSIPNHPSLNFDQTLSMMAWVRTQENKTTKIVQKGDWDGHGLGQGKWDGWNAHIRTADNATHVVHWLGGLPVFNEWYHLAMTYDGNILKLYVNGQLRNSKTINGPLKINNRTASIGSDNGVQKFFNGQIDEVKIFGAALSQTEIQAHFHGVGQAGDRDGDGVADQDDIFPDDPARAFENFFPAAGFGSLAFEDLWPNKGDYDFNDLVVDYHFRIVTNASNKVTEVMASFVVKAIGAGFQNGFGFQWDDNQVLRADIQAEGSIITENYIVLDDNGTEAGLDMPTFIVFDNSYSVLAPSTGFGVNVTPGHPYVEPDTIRLNISIKPGTYGINELAVHTFNPFLIIDRDRGKEVHLPNRKPTTKASVDYFGLGQDNSDPGAGRYYKTPENLPWALNIVSVYAHTIEGFQITSAHLKFADWAQSSGTMFPDWFENKSGYRDQSKIYQPGR
jgi:LruC domain-containing protein